MKYIRLLAVLLLLLLLPGCSGAGEPNIQLPDAVGSAAELHLRLEDQAFRYRRTGPGEAELTVTEGYAAGLSMVLRDGVVTVSLEGVGAEIPVSELPEGAPILELTRLLDGLISAESRQETIGFRAEGEAEVYSLGALGSVRVESGGISELLCLSGKRYLADG